MSSSHPLDRALVDAAYEIARRNWSRKFRGAGYVAVNVPGEAHDAFVSVSFDADSNGVDVLRGAGARAALLNASVASPAGSGEPAFGLLGFSMTESSKATPEAIELMRRAGRELSGLGRIPSFSYRVAGRRGRPPNRDERRVLLYVLHALLRADDDGMLRPAPVARGANLTRLTASGDPLRPEIAYETIKFIDVSGGAVDVATDFDDVRDLASLPRIDRAYGAHLVKAPSESGERLDRMHILFVLDVESGRMMDAAPVDGRDVEEAARRLEAAFGNADDPSEHGVPREIHCTSEDLRGAVAKRLEPFGVRCLLNRNLPSIDESFDRFVAAAASVRHDSSEADEPVAPDDLSAWKAADRAVCEMVGRQVVFGRHVNPPNAGAFFGDGETAYRFIEQAGKDGALMMAFCEWFFVSGTSRKRPHSLLEHALAENPPRTIRALLEARRDGRTSIFLVESATPGESLELRDVSTGRRTKVTDIEMSKSAKPGFILAARLHAAGAFNFASLLSPAFAPADHQAVFEVLRRAGAGVGLEKLYAKPHLVGRLWDLASALARTPRPAIRLTNFDGEPHVKHEALYSMNDPAGAREALLSREGVDGDESTDAYVWTRKEAPGRKPISNTIVARLRLIGESLLVSTNSAKRHQAAHRWIRKIPGVRLVSVKTEPFDLNRKGPKDDALPSATDERAELAPESAAELQAAFDAYAEAWIDEKIPVLGGKTPRQAVKTAPGRARVRLLLNSMSDPSA
jgi:hypothetical protein